jgi:hypothetical protein
MTTITHCAQTTTAMCRAAAATQVPVIGAVNVGSSLGVCDILAAIGGRGGSITISGGGANLGVDALRVGGNDSIVSVGDLSMSGRCSSSGSDALATGKGSGILRVSDSVVPAMGGDILGTGIGSGPDHIAFHQSFHDYSSSALRTQGE